MGDREIRYSDPRRFGQVSTVDRGREREHPALAVLGRDPIEETIDGDWLYQQTRASRRTLKAFLLDQRVIAGVGNIYACEALWEARIRPTLRAHQLSRPRAAALAAAVRAVLDRALTHGGTSLRDFVDADGREGENSHYLWVYGRDDEPCMRPDCGTFISRRVIEGRATFFCRRCQQR
jgi:formamidopyrimidine-DNA glycosylase